MWGAFTLADVVSGVLADGTHARSSERFPASGGAVADHRRSAPKNALQRPADADILQVATARAETAVRIPLSVTTIDALVEGLALGFCPTHAIRPFYLRSVKC